MSRARKTHCIRGHELTEANCLKSAWPKIRKCRPCQALREAERRVREGWPENRCPRCRGRFVGRSKSAHVRHCGRVLPLATPMGLVAARGELRRVARLCGRPEGVAPSLLDFRRHSAWSEKRIRGAFGGYRNGNPVVGWRGAVQKLGFTPAEFAHHSDHRRIVADIRRVASDLRKPTRMPTQDEYNSLGRWCVDTARLHFGGARWNEIAAQLGLKPNLPPPFLRRSA